MVCEKCKKELKKQFSYCPYCGAKYSELTPFTRLVWFESEVGRKDAKSAWDYMKSLDFEELEQYLCERLPSFDVFSVSGSYERTNKHYLDKRRCVFSSISRKKALELVAGEKAGIYSNVIFYSNRKRVTTGDLKNLGDYIFLTERECENFIDFLRIGGDESEEETNDD